MFTFLSAFITFFFSFIVWDIYIKQYVQSKIKSRIDPYLINIFNIIDKEMPERLKTNSGKEIKNWIKEIIKEVVDNDDDMILERNAKYILNLYDPTINADKLKPA